MIEFRRNKKTGILEVWKDGKKIGEIITMGDEVIENEQLRSKTN
jgi:hypothetical protein